MRKVVGSSWRADLIANSHHRGLLGAAIAWFTSPGFAVVCLYRVSRWGKRRGGLFKVVSLLAWRAIVKGYACYLNPEADIGPGLCLPHPVGVVVGDGVLIGANVTLYQGVTIGRRTADVGAVPRLSADVCVYANATIVGPITVGEGAVIAAHAFVCIDVPVASTVAGIPAIVTKVPVGVP